MKQKKKGLTLALILAACCMQALSVEKVDDKEVVGSSITTLDAPRGVAEGTASLYSHAESPSKAAEATIEPSPIPVVPLENTSPDTAIETVTSSDPVDGVSTGVEEAVAEETFFDKVWGYLWADDESVKAKAKFMKKKFDLKKKYGEDAIREPSLSTILQIEADSREADNVREQKQLALEVEEAVRQKLYYESLECLALNGYHEARDQTADQEVASAAVVLNRLSVGFRDATTVCEVIYTPKQFSWVEQHGVHTPDTSNKIEKQAWERSLLIARRMLDPDATFIDPSNGALYYYNPSLVDWKYADHYVQVAVLGNHRFMTEPDDNHPHRIDNSQVRINPVLFNGLSHEERKILIQEYQAGD